MKIIIDVGHAKNTGARGAHGEEHELCKPIAHLLADMLKHGGDESQVVDFEDLSNSADLNATINYINAQTGVDAVISLHMDWASNAQACGASVLHYPNSLKGKALALCIASPLDALMFGRAQVVKPRGDLAILRRTTPPAVLAELGFLSNKGDHKIQVEEPERIAAALYEGLMQWKGEVKL